MSFQNFSYLQEKWPQLYEHGIFSEKYIWSDPQSAVVKLRCFAELLVGILYKELNLESDSNADLFTRLNSPVFTDLIDANIIQKLHVIRMLGNKAAHGKNKIAPVNAEKLYYDAYLLGKWLYRTYVGCNEYYPDYIKPQKPVNYEHILENQAILKAQLDEAIKELEDLENAEKIAIAENLRLQEQLNIQEREFQQHQDRKTKEAFRLASSSAVDSFDLNVENTRDLISLSDAFDAYTLTKGQSELVQQLELFLKSKDNNVFLLKGYAGTGKTFITKGLTEYFNAVGRNFTLAAPTGKAAKVIAKKTQVNAHTIHKTIYDMDEVKEYIEEGVDGSQTYRFFATLKTNLDSTDRVYIVDEASMIADIYQDDEFFRFGSGFVLSDFFEYVNLDNSGHNKKVIFIGDNAQLPPVGMNFSPALNSEYLASKFNVTCLNFELTEVVRQKSESGVINNANSLRVALEKNTFNKLSIDSNYADINKVSYTDVIEKYLQSCGNKINGESIIIAHSNADVASFNEQIRAQFFPGQKTIVSGDKVMAITNDDNHGLFISNGDFGLIRRVASEPEIKTITLKSKNKETDKVEVREVTLIFREVNVGFKDLLGKSHFFDTKIIENLLYSNQANLTSDENKALYIDFCIRHPRPQFRKELLKSDPYFNAMRFKFGYAITCHKAQGSEWNHVFVKCKTHQNQLTRDYFRWLYTAITRTVSNLYLLEAPKIGVGSQIKMVGMPNFIENTSNENKVTNSLGTVSGEHTKSESNNIAERFAIPTNALFSRELLSQVCELIKDQGIIIQDVSLGQYQDIYFFQKEMEIARINIYYNGKGHITRLIEPKPTELGQQLILILDSLKNKSVVVSNVGSQGVTTEFMEDYQLELHEKLIEIISNHDVEVAQVSPRDWALRYTFIQAGESVTFDIFYNGKKQFTKCLPVGSGNIDLMGVVSNIIAEGLK